MKKKILSYLILLCMVISLLPANITVHAAANGTCGDNLTWTLDDNGTLTISGNGKMDDYCDSSETPWYSTGISVKSLIVNDGVTDIGGYAFWYCSELTNITLPDSITTISDASFTNCDGLESIILPKSLTTIYPLAFEDCDNLTDVTIPDTLTRICECAFYGCRKLSTVYYNGSENDWNKIKIENLNDDLINATRSYFAYINIFDKDENKVVSTTQNMGEKLDTSAITVPDGAILKLYTDKEMTQEYSLDTPISENLTLYYDLIEINKLKASGAESADIGQKGVTYTVSFATDKTAKDFIATIKYSDKLILSTITEKDFSITDQSSDTIDGYTYLYLTCEYKNDGNMPANTTLKPFELIFDVSESARANDILTVEFIGDETFLANDNGNTYDFDSFGTAAIKVNPIPVKSITIIGADEIDTPTQYTAVISPENATNKEIEWSVDNSEIAAISQDGTLTPQKAGTVKITATAKDGSGIVGEKTVNVRVYAQITSLSANVGVWNKDFAPAEREYVIYVPQNTTSIKLTAQHQGTLKLGSKIFYKGKATTIQLAENETILNLVYTSDGYTDSAYKITVVKFDGTKTTVSEDGTTFTIKPINVETGNTVVLALYDGDKFVGMQFATFDGADLTFTTDNSYTNAKVMVWNSIDKMTPVCDVEKLK